MSPYILIETTYRENRAIADDAVDLGVSERRLSRACRKAADSSLLKMVLERRITEANRLSSRNVLNEMLKAPFTTLGGSTQIAATE